MRVVLVLGVVGNLLRIFAVAFVPPLLLAMVDGEMEVAGWFAIALVATFLAGTFLARWFERTKFLHRSEAMAVVAGSWLLVAAFGSIPYLFHGIAPVNAFFESMSGFTTTGATILTDFDQYGRAFYLWRAMTQWFGGLGVIALFIVVLPRLGIAGRQLFFAEASGAASEGISPQVRSGARKLWILYVGLTALLSVLLTWFGGMNVYEGIVHGLTTMSAGGFSPNGESILGYQSSMPETAAVREWILIVFMVLSGTSFTLQYKAFTGQPGALLRDGEFLAYLALCVLGAVAIALVLGGGSFDMEQLRSGAFQTTSLASSTGYASADYEQWSQSAKILLVVIMLVGGCAGSACGGPKVIRYLLTGKFLRREMTRTLHPRAVLPIRYKGSVISVPVMRSVVTLVALYMLHYLVVGTAVTLIDSTTMEEGMSASLACLGNIGPAFGAAGPMGNFDHFSVASKILLSVSMWLGRLEIVTVLALSHRDVWHNLRWRETRRP